jgi:hypothetical protein
MVLPDEVMPEPASTGLILTNFNRGGPVLGPGPSPMRRDHKIRLTSEQEDDLQRFARSRTLPARLVERAKMLVGYSAGHGVEEVAAQLNVAVNPPVDGAYRYVATPEPRSFIR